MCACAYACAYPQEFNRDRVIDHAQDLEQNEYRCDVCMIVCLFVRVVELLNSFQGGTVVLHKKYIFMCFTYELDFHFYGLSSDAA